MTSPTMTIDGVEYREAKPLPKRLQNNEERTCSGCAFIGRYGTKQYHQCMRVTCVLAPQAFGGDCGERGVIYVRQVLPGGGEK